MKSGTDTRRSRKQIRVSEEMHTKLVKYAQSKKIPLVAIVEDFIEKGVNHDIYDPDWAIKLADRQREYNAYATLDKECPALSYGLDENEKGVWKCVWSQPDRPPFIKVLGKTESLMGSACESCDATKLLRLSKEADYDKIMELETKLKESEIRYASEKFRAPICKGGAILTNDGTQFTGCKRTRLAVSVTGYCKIQKYGTPCSLYSEVVIGLSDKKTEENLGR